MSRKRDDWSARESPAEVSLGAAVSGDTTKAGTRADEEGAPFYEGHLMGDIGRMNAEQRVADV